MIKKLKECNDMVIRIIILTFICIVSASCGLFVPLTKLIVNKVSNIPVDASVDSKDIFKCISNNMAPFYKQCADNRWPYFSSSEVHIVSDLKRDSLIIHQYILSTKRREPIENQPLLSNKKSILINNRYIHTSQFECDRFIVESEGAESWSKAKVYQPHSLFYLQVTRLKNRIIVHEKLYAPNPMSSAKPATDWKKNLQNRTEAINKQVSLCINIVINKNKE